MKQLLLGLTALTAVVVAPEVAAANHCTPEYEWRGGPRLSGLGVARASQGYLATWMDGDRERYVVWDSALAARLATGERAEPSQYGRSWSSWVGGDAHFLRIAVSGNSVELERIDLEANRVDAVTLDAGRTIDGAEATFDGSSWIVVAASQYGNVGETIHLWRFPSTSLSEAPSHHTFIADESWASIGVFVRKVGAVTWAVWGGSNGTFGARLSRAGELLDSEPVMLHEEGPTGFGSRGDEGAVFAAEGRAILDEDGVTFAVTQAPLIRDEVIGIESGYAVGRAGRVGPFPSVKGDRDNLTLISPNTYELTQIRLDVDELVVQRVGPDLLVLDLTDTTSTDAGTRSLTARRLLPSGELTALPAEEGPLAAVEYSRHLIRDCPAEPPSTGSGDGSGGGGLPFGWEIEDDGNSCSAAGGAGSAPLILLALAIVTRRRRRV